MWERRLKKGFLFVSFPYRRRMEMSLFDLNKGELEKLVPSQNEKEKWAFFSASAVL